MAEVINGTGSVLVESYKFVVSTLPPFFQGFVNLFVIVFLIFIYSLFVWKFHKFVARKDIFGLDLNQYNKAESPLAGRFMHGFFYFLEYIIISPFVIFFWFVGFTIFLIVMGKNFDVNTTLIISAAVVTAIRMASYYNEALSKELAKLLPLNLLALSLIESGFFDVPKILNQFSQIPGILSNVAIYFVFIITLEIILRFFDFTFSMFGLEEESGETEEERIV